MGLVTYRERCGCGAAMEIVSSNRDTRFVVGETVLASFRAAHNACRRPVKARLAQWATKWR